jgi:hypothetical protein
VDRHHAGWLMAVFSTDFSEYTLGDITTQGWTQRYDATRTYTVVERAGSISGKALLDSTSPGGGEQRLISWDTVGATHQDVDVVAAIRPTTWDSGSWNFLIGLRGSGAVGTETYTAAGIHNSSSHGKYRVISGSYGANTDGAFAFSLNTLYYIRFRVTNDAWWYAISANAADIALDGSNVPVGGWTASGTGLHVDSIQAGWVGITSYQDDQVGEWEWFSVGTAGDFGAMPGEASGPPWTLTTNVVGSGSVNKSPDQVDYADQAVVELTAVAAAGWSFASWSGDLTGSVNPQSLTMDANKTVTATFTEDTGVGTPANVVVTVNSRTSATVTWDDVVGADVFQVEARVRAGTT